MDEITRESLKRILRIHEGLSLKPYRCTEGFLTIGYGRNIELNGISKDEAELMLKNDIEWALDDANSFSWFDKLNEARKVVIICMLVNLGKKKLLSFKKMIAALEIDDYATAAKEMLDSKWATQVGTRSTELAVTMKMGEL